MNDRLGKVNLNLPKIILDSGASSSVIILVFFLKEKKHERRISKNSVVSQKDVTLILFLQLNLKIPPELYETEIVICNFHIDEF